MKDAEETGGRRVVMVCCDSVLHTCTHGTAIGNDELGTAACLSIEINFHNPADNFNNI